MRTQTGYMAMVAFLVFAFHAPARAGNMDEWARAKEVRGSFGILLGTAASDPKASALIHTEMKGFILQGTVVLKQVKASADSILFQGAAKGLLFMQHKAEVLEGQAAASEQACSGAFDNGEFLLELFPQEGEYQVQFSGEVPGCAVTTQYPAFKLMTQIFGKWHEEYKNLGSDWAPFAADLKSAHDSFAKFSATEKKQEPVTFSATAEPDMKRDPKSNFPVMHFYPLPAKGARLAGTGKVQLIVSTSVFPTTLSTEAHWSLQAVK